MNSNPSEQSTFVHINVKIKQIQSKTLYLAINSEKKTDTFEFITAKFTKYKITVS